MAKRASACVRNYAAGTAKSKTANAAETNDVVKRVFVEQQTKFRALLAKTKDLKPPVGGDATAVKAYATKKLAILKELDISTPGEKILETVDGAFAEATTVRGFLEYASELRQMLGLKDEDDTMKVMVSALDDTEKALGKALMTSDAQGMAKYGAAVAKASEAAGIKPLDAAAMAKLQGEVDLESIENEILELQAVEDEVKKEEA